LEANEEKNNEEGGKPGKEAISMLEVGKVLTSTSVQNRVFKKCKRSPYLARMRVLNNKPKPTSHGDQNECDRQSF
jgi:hypothetical protein